jgi:hypothetical protein
LQIALVRRFPGPEYTFILAGFLKILTIGGLAQSAPVDAVRTALGELLQDPCWNGQRRVVPALGVTGSMHTALKQQGGCAAGYRLQSCLTPCSWEPHCAGQWSPWLMVPFALRECVEGASVAGAGRGRPLTKRTSAFPARVCRAVLTAAGSKSLRQPARHRLNTTSPMHNNRIRPEPEPAS